MTVTEAVHIEPSVETSSGAPPTDSLSKDAQEAYQLVMFVHDKGTLDIAQQAAAGVTPENLCTIGDFKAALNYLSRAPAPSCLVVDIHDHQDPTSAVFSFLSLLPQNTRLIVIGTLNDIRLYREFVEAGVSDYLVKPLQLRDFQRALLYRSIEKSDAMHAATAGKEETQKERKVISVLGSRGGCGASTIAINLAWMAASEHKNKKTALVDLDLEFGTSALALDIETTRGLRDALEAPERIDGLFISQASSRVNPRLSLLSAEEILDENSYFSPEAIESLFNALLKVNDVVVVDVPRNHIILRDQALAASTEIVLVTDVSLAGLRDSIRLLRSLGQRVPDIKPVVVANHSGRGESMPFAEFSRTLEHEIRVAIPHDHRLFVRLGNRGRAVVTAKGTTVAKKIEKLSSLITDGHEESSRSSRWHKFKKKPKEAQ